MTRFAASMIPNLDFSERVTSRAVHFPLGNMNQSGCGIRPMPLANAADGGRAAAPDLRHCSHV